MERVIIRIPMNNLVRIRNFGIWFIIIDCLKKLQLLELEVAAFLVVNKSLILGTERSSELLVIVILGEEYALILFVRLFQEDGFVIFTGGPFVHEIVVEFATWVAGFTTRIDHIGFGRVC